jgi:pterin-4a-carbinolamine dehydratase
MQPFTFFISYRRQDTAPIALLLKNEIEKRLQFVRVSVDVEEILPGEDFPPRLCELIGGAHAAIALIGRHWMPRVDAGAPAAGNAGAADWVATEVEYVKSLPLAMSESDRFGLTERAVLPVFVDCPRDFRQFVLAPPVAYLAQLQAEYIDYAGWPAMIGPLLDRIAIRLALKKRPDADTYPTPDPAKARTQPLPDLELAQILRYDDYDGWYVDNYGNAEVRYLVKTFKFRGFNQAADFIKLVSDHCRVLDHHPEWRNVFNHVTVSLTTWDAQRRVTIYDLNLALYMNMAAKVIAKNG